MNAYLAKKDFRKIYSKDWDNITMFSEGGTECYVLTSKESYVVVFEVQNLHLGKILRQTLFLLNQKENGCHLQGV